jgi:hypothetical protein
MVSPCPNRTRGNHWMVTPCPNPASGNHRMVRAGAKRIGTNHWMVGGRVKRTPGNHRMVGQPLIAGAEPAGGLHGCLVRANWRHHAIACGLRKRTCGSGERLRANRKLPWAQQPTAPTHSRKTQLWFRRCTLSGRRDSSRLTSLRPTTQARGLHSL